MPYLSSSISKIKDHYTVVVIGSGYGGAIAASRLARAGQKVCVLERGKEFQPGDYPDTLPEAAAEMQLDAPSAHVGPRTGLYDFRLNPDINVFLGCGLGGTSLVNANVSIEPEARTFDDERWPKELRQDLQTKLKEGFERATEMLKPSRYPEDQDKPDRTKWPRLPKTRAVENASRVVKEQFDEQGIKMKFATLPINVNFDIEGVNHVGVVQHPCTLCGDCVSGCNHSAKNTLIMNYLPDARNFGAEIYTQVAVRHIERSGKQWRVHYQLLDSGREAFHAPTLFVTADIVIVSAGSLGSTEILLRSKEAGLATSDQLGHRFTGNGDVLAFGYNNHVEIRGIGFGHRPVREMDAVGPCITSVIDLRGQDKLNDGMVIEEGSIPGALGDLVPGTLAVLAQAIGKKGPSKSAQAIADEARRITSALLGPYHGAARNTQTYLVMSHDDGAGRLVLEDGRLRVVWPGVGEQKIFKQVDERFQAITQGLGGVHIKNPTWTDLTNHNVVTVHPLGGCVMGEEAASGVVNHKGQVFAGATGTAVHDGLYVSDGAVIPRSLGVNPLLTISAVAERCVALIAADRGWSIDYQIPSGRTGPEPETRRLGIQFTETMSGYLSTRLLSPQPTASRQVFEDAATQGKKDKSSFQFTITVTSDDLNAMLGEPEHAARMIGTAEAPGLSPRPLTVTEGRFNLFVKDPDHVGQRRMLYRMKLTSEERKVFWLDGYKLVRNDAGLDIWPDTSTLYVTLRDGDSEAATMLGRGVLHILPEDFQRQMTTLDVRHPRNKLEELEATARFGQFFAGSLFEIYGGIAARSILQPVAPPREKRPLRLCAPEVHVVNARQSHDSEAQVQLRLTRFNGGGNGPIILAPGFGTSSAAFLIDTTETNLPEYLYAHGYDVWAFDYRASPALPSAHDQFSVDEIARYDWPAVVAKVRELSGAPSVQVLGHCVGSMSFLMAMLSGLKGVRSAVCSQLTTHPDSPLLTNLKAGGHLGDLLWAAGVHVMKPDFDRESFIQQALDKVMLFYPSKEHCESPVCRRILFMYGEVYKHDLLNVATHEAIHEMFGNANFTTLRHITTMIRNGKVVDYRGGDVYMPNIQRLAIPITFIHGSENRMFIPSGSEEAYDELCQANGKELYARRVIHGYGHMDCFIGRDAAEEVYPIIVEELARMDTLDKPVRAAKVVRTGDRARRTPGGSSPTPP